MGRLSVTAIACAVATTIASCTGIVGDPGAEPGSSPPHARPPETGPSAEPPLPIRPRRLSNDEYAASVRDVLGVDASEQVASFPADPTVFGFTNNAETTGMSDGRLAHYQEAAEAIAERIVGDDAEAQRVTGCAAPEDEACFSRFVESFGLRAFRRPLSAADVEAFLALARTRDGADRWGALRLVIEATLLHPRFLYRVEEGTLDASGRYALDGYDIASRLSFTVLGTTPDVDLLAAAGAGELADADGVERWALRLLDDSRAREGLRRFAGEWLRLSRLSNVARDPAAYPSLTPQAVSSMREQTLRAFEDVFVSDRDVGELLTTRSYMIDEALAPIYGVSVAGGFTRVDLDESSERSGILTHASVLNLTARSEAAAPITRGAYVRDVFMCDPPTPPPASVVPVVPEALPGESDRDRLARHRTDPACAGCHSFLEPLGFGLARFDVAGELRTHDASGAEISAAGSFDGWTDIDFDGPVELGEMLRADPEVNACFVRQVFRWAAGRRESSADEQTLDALAEAFERDGRTVRAVVIALVRGEAFRARGPGE